MTGREGQFEVEVTQQQLLALAADVGNALTCCEHADEMLHNCAQALVDHLGVSFARIWVCEEATDTLVLRASAGLYTHLDGNHARIKVGQYKIGLIAQERKPHLTNEVLNDDRISDKEWAKKEGMVAFAGHPLLVQDRLVGVLGMFAKNKLPEATLLAVASVADGIALAVNRLEIAGRLRERELLFDQFANNISDAIWIAEPHAKKHIYISPAHEKIFGTSAQELYDDPLSFLNAVVPEDRPRMIKFMELTESLTANSQSTVTDLEYRITKPNGDVRWLWSRAFPSFNDEGRVYQICGFTHDITEKKEAERRVSEFYSMVSHELRTPLTSIRAALGLIEGGVTASDTDETLELITIARKESDRLIRLINDILDMRKMEAGKLPLTIAPLEPRQVVEGTLAAMRSFAQEHNVELVNWIHEERSFLGDQDRVLQVLTNLLSNAIKFSPPNKKVSVTVQAGFAGRIRFAVSDEGPGIPPEQHAKLFGIFQQLDSSDSRARGGTGLGLAISKAIVEKLGGVIGFNSEVGKGSTFWFELPFTDPASPDAPLPSELAVDGSNVLLRDLIDEYAKKLPARLRSLADCLKEAKLNGRTSEIHECLTEVRKIRASAEPCGFSEVAAAMSQIEKALLVLLTNVEDPVQWAAIDAALERTRAASL